MDFYCAVLLDGTEGGSYEKTHKQHHGYEIIFGNISYMGVVVERQTSVSLRPGLHSKLQDIQGYLEGTHVNASAT